MDKISELEIAIEMAAAAQNQLLDYIDPDVLDPLLIKLIKNYITANNNSFQILVKIFMKNDQLSIGFDSFYAD